MARLMIGAVAALLGAIAVAAAVALLTARDPAGPAGPNTVDATGADIGGPFRLVDQHGDPVSSEALIDGPVLLYFGYTFCPDVCPVDVAVMADATDRLRAAGVDVTPAFITVDPARDTPEALAPWAEAMHPDLVALTGSEAAIAEAAEAYKVYYAQGDSVGSGADYLMNHSAFIYLMTPEGLQALFRHGATAEEIAAEALRVLDG